MRQAPPTSEPVRARFTRWSEWLAFLAPFTPGHMLSSNLPTRLLLAAFVVCIAPAPLHGQRAPDGMFRSNASGDWPTPTWRAEVAGGSVVRAGLGGLLGGALGVLAGGLAGGGITSRDCESGNPDQCLGLALPGMVWGAAVGHTLAIPVGAHLANGRRGSLPRSLLVSGGIFAAEALAIAALVQDGRTTHGALARGILVGTPFVQLVTSVLIESRRPR